MKQRLFLSNIILPAVIVCVLILIGNAAYSSNAGDLFGYSVSVWSDRALIAAPYNDTNNQDGGQAYLFDSRPEMRQKLIPNDSTNGNTFGYAVSLRDGSAVIGAANSDRQGINSGEAYVFNTKGKQLHTLSPTNGKAGDLFGSAVAVRGRYAVIGAPYSDSRGLDSGSAYLFDIATGKQIREFIPDNGGAGDLYGSAVALNDRYVLIGAPYRDGRGKDSGSADLFDLRTGKKLQELIANDSSAGDLFSYSVSLNSQLAFIGAPYNDRRGQDVGTAYLFKLSNGEQLKQVDPNSGSAGDLFGYSVAINSEYAVIGAPYSDSQGADSGAAYGFLLADNRQLPLLTGKDMSAGDLFGYDVAIFNEYVLVGAPYADDGSPDNGSAYSFNIINGQQVAKY
jgi:WD40 repeat protein